MICMSEENPCVSLVWYSNDSIAQTLLCVYVYSCLHSCFRRNTFTLKSKTMNQIHSQINEYSNTSINCNLPGHNTSGCRILLNATICLYLLSSKTISLQGWDDFVFCLWLHNFDGQKLHNISLKQICFGVVLPLIIYPLNWIDFQV